MPYVVLGNTAPIEAIKPDPATTEVERVARPDLGKTETTWSIPNDEPLTNAINAVTAIWHSHHSDDDPAWVESDDPILAEALAREFACVVGRPSDWEDQKAESREGNDSEPVVEDTYPDGDIS